MAKSMMSKNWAGNIRYQARRLHLPRTVEEVRSAVSQSKKMRVLGTRHSFNGIADCGEDLLSLEHMNKVLALDPVGSTVTVEGGITYGQLCPYLDHHGFALQNLASLPHISVAGACATATHGAGRENGILATSVTGIQFVTADGTVMELSYDCDEPLVCGAVVGLGAVGVVTRLTLKIQPAFSMRQCVYEDLSLECLESEYDALMTSAHSISLFSRWNDEAIDQIWVKQRVRPDDSPPASQIFGARLSVRPLHPIGGFCADACTDQQGRVGSWHDRLPHFRLDHVPSSGDELQSEYLIPRQHVLEAIRVICQQRESIRGLLQISEIREVAADELWMSPCYQRPCVGIHFTWKKQGPAVRAVLSVIEDALAPFDARPHWGKLFVMEPSRVQSLYHNVLERFQNLILRFDPGGKFRNPFVDTYIFSADSPNLATGF